MGQQQLLLIVFGIVIVGVAIIIGITTYAESSSRSNSDSILQDVLRISSDAQTWKLKPEIFGGSPDAVKSDRDDYSDVDFFVLGYGDGVFDADCYYNSNGEFVLFPTNSGLGIMGTSVTNSNIVAVVVTGSLNDDIGLYSADWNPIRGGLGADGTKEVVDSHKRCNGKSQRPIQAGGT